MKDLINMEWVLAQLNYNLVESKRLITEESKDFLCNKLIKQHLHDEYIQSIAPSLPPKAFSNFILELDENYYERFTLDEMLLIELKMENNNFIIEGDINNYINEQRLVDNKEFVYLKSKIIYKNVSSIKIENALEERVILTQPFKYSVNLIYGGFSYNVEKNIHSYTVYLQSVPKNKSELNEIVKDLKKYTFQISFNYEDIDLELGKELPTFLKKEND